MAKKQKSKILQFVKFGFIGLCLLGVSFLAVNRVLHGIKNVDYFNIQAVTFDPSLQFINKRDLRRVIGKNIFAVDIKGIQRQLNRKYPQASGLKVHRRMPNLISVTAKQRLPFAQIQIQNQIVVIDNEGIILSLQKKMEKKLPDIIGTELRNPKIALGLPLRGSDLSMALRIIRLFSANDSLNIYAIASINIGNMSKIQCTLTNDIDFIIDRGKMVKKLRSLGAVLAQGNLKLKKNQFIDLRFKDPIIGNKK